ncbi:hypothetical protein PR048_016793 [Dryococelus australis]|uniref:Large ribosomal subunit protein mL42 n=1 Tax=Dryococelus australis TaxID=614101 RepID=A0ABQ9H7W5_9NEOP|nr:hypothetical protein PR048_016793 [Dryococelus australis]
MFGRIPLAPLRVSRPTSSMSSFRRPASRDSTAATPQDAVVVVTDDGSTVACWHPEQPFPYELSRPLPEEPRVEAGGLNLQSAGDVRDQLMRITYTTKHIWVPKGRAQYRRKIDPDREYL